MSWKEAIPQEWFLTHNRDTGEVVTKATRRINHLDLGRASNAARIRQQSWFCHTTICRTTVRGS